LRIAVPLLGIAAACVYLAGGARAAEAGALQTAVTNFAIPADGSDADIAYARVKGTGSTHILLGLNWAAAAPAKPAGDRSDPANPGYRWAVLDEQVRRAYAVGLEPILTIIGAPPWAEGKPSGAVRPDPVDRRFRGAFRPDPVEFGRFAKAAATRFSGASAGSRRVRLWQAWSEPNVSVNLLPQYISGRPASPAWYRNMVNRFADGVHAVHRDNLVIAGGLSPFTVRNSITVAIGPLRFMRALLCLGKGPQPRSTCPHKTRFDIWSHHPYTSGGPTRHAYHPDDVSLGDMPEMRRLLDAGVKKGKVVSRQKVRFWVTEFGWDTKPPDLHPRAVPIKLHARWVAEALYRMWRAGVSLVTWFQLRDERYPASALQTGLYFNGGSFTRDQPKPALAAFRFPLVAFRERGGRVLVWGRTPAGRRGRVLVERTSGRGWRRLALLSTDRNGMFLRHLKLPAAGSARTTSSVVFRRAGDYRQAVLADSPRFYWRLGERSGQSGRDEVGGRTAIYRGGVRLGQPGALRGDRDTAIRLDGTNDRVELGRISSPRTVELWQKTETTRESAAFSNRNSINHYTLLGPEGGGGPLVFDTTGLLGAKWVTDGRWHHLVYTHDGALGRLYVDGVPDSIARWPRLEGEAPASLGYDASLKSYLRGSLDEVALYDYALSEAQVKRHFQASGQTATVGDQFGIVGKGTYVRARLADGSASSLPFSLTRPPDRFVLPFGGGGG